MTDLDERLAALAEAAELAEGRLPEEDVARAFLVVGQAGDRIGHGLDHTVVALAGATGSGKSSLFNALAGEDLATVGVRRPTTSTAQSCVWGEDPATDLLDWLEVPTRHHKPVGAPGGPGLVLLDLPDFDSTQTDHRLEVDRLVELVDLLAWVVDPEKYSDAALHEGYLRPLADHGDVMMMILNKVDRLRPDERAACVNDLGRRLDDDGLSGVPILAVSAETGTGVGELRAQLVKRVEARTAALARLEADVIGAGEALRTHVSGTASTSVGRRHRRRLVTALADAAGAPLVTEAVAASYRRDASGRTGWPFTRWVRRFRPDPLRRLHLERGGGGVALPSLPRASASARARVLSEIRDVTDSAAGHLPEPWPGLAREAASRDDDLDDQLSKAMAGADLGGVRDPIWWSVAGVVQLVAAVAVAVGLAWLTAMFAFAYVGLPEPPTSSVGRVPVPTALLIGGIIVGLVVAFVSRQLANVGASRRAKRAQKAVEAAVTSVADDHIIGPVESELAVVDDLRNLLTKVV